MSEFDFVIQKENCTLEVDLRGDRVMIYACEPHTCFGVSLTEAEVESLIDNLKAMKENMQ